MSIFDTAQFFASAAKLNQFPVNDYPEVAFAGRSNAGKSTTINVLTRRTRLAYSSKIPGRTQLINFFSLSKKVGREEYQTLASLVDLPGYGFALAPEVNRQSWGNLVGGYIAQRPNLRALVLVMDARRPFRSADLWIIDFMRSRPEVKMLWLINKADQIKNQEKALVMRDAQERAKEFGDNVRVQLFSGLKRIGVEDLQATLLEWLNLNES